MDIGVYYKFFYIAPKCALRAKLWGSIAVPWLLYSLGRVMAGPLLLQIRPEM